MKRGPLSRTTEGPPQESPGTIGGSPPVVDQLPTAIETSTDTPETVSRRQSQQSVQDEQQPSTGQAEYTDQHIQAEHREPDHTGLADTPVPSHNEDSNDWRSVARPLAGHTDQSSSHWEPLAAVKHGVIEAITFVAFLAAVSFPFLYLPLLLFGGFDSSRTTGFLVLIALHAVSLAIGYRYEPRKPFGVD